MNVYEQEIKKYNSEIINDLECDLKLHKSFCDKNEFDFVITPNELFNCNSLNDFSKYKDHFFLLRKNLKILFNLIDKLEEPNFIDLTKRELELKDGSYLKSGKINLFGITVIFDLDNYNTRINYIRKKVDDFEIIFYKRESKLKIINTKRNYELSTNLTSLFNSKIIKVKKNSTAYLYSFKLNLKKRMPCFKRFCNEELFQMFENKNKDFSKLTLPLLFDENNNVVANLSLLKINGVSFKVLESNLKTLSIENMQIKTNILTRSFLSDVIDLLPEKLKERFEYNNYYYRKTDSLDKQKKEILKNQLKDNLNKQQKETLENKLKDNLFNFKEYLIMFGYNCEIFSNILIIKESIEPMDMFFENKEYENYLTLNKKV